MLNILRFWAVIASINLAITAFAQEKPKDVGKPPTPAAKKETHKVTKGPFKVEIRVKGILEADNMAEILLSPEAFTPDNRGQLRVLKAVPLGTHVKKGDQVVWLDMEKIDQMITDLEKEQGLADLSLKLAKEDLDALEKVTPLDLQSAERAKKQAGEDLSRFLEQDKDYSVKMIDYEVKLAANYLIYAKEELQQLEKMYKASDLTESTEQIILKRQRDMVERAAFYVKMAEYDRDYTFKVTLPRREETLKDSERKQTLALDKIKTTAPLLLNQKRLSLEKMRFDRERAAEKLMKFKKDRDSMVVKAPADGVVYYGKCVRGQWATGAADSKLQRGGMLLPDEVFMTIVEPRPVFVRATIEEKEFGNIKAGLAAKVVPTALPDLKLPAKVDKVLAIPVSSGNFEATLSLKGAKNSTLVPGMACAVKLVTYQKTDALAVPAQAVFTDDMDEDVRVVYLQGKDDNATKVNVKVGKKSGTKIEIQEGLHEGDVILMEKPAPEAGKK